MKRIVSALVVTALFCCKMERAPAEPLPDRILAVHHGAVPSAAAPADEASVVTQLPATSNSEAPAPPLLAPAGEDYHEGVIDNLSFFLGLDGSKQPQDFGINANMGGRAAVNWGFPIWEEYGLGVQIGTGLNYSDNAVHVIDQISHTTDRWQSFTTFGFFDRTPWGVNVGLVYDFLFERYSDHLTLSQWRGHVGYEVTDCDEIGARFALRDRGDSTVFLGEPVHFAPLTQCNFFWRHTWPLEAQTMWWLGVGEEHGRVVFVLPPNPKSDEVLVFGSELSIPLSDHFAIFGAANFFTPFDTGTVDAYLGFVFYPGGGAREAAHRRFAPMLPVANNPEFAVDLRR